MWLKLLTWLTLLQLIAGDPGKLKDQAVKGSTVSIGNYPYLVNLRRGKSFTCNGALISPSCVVTAAHCLGERLQYIPDLYVHAQQECLQDAAQKRQAWYAWIASQSSPYCGPDGDLTVLKLSQPFDMAGNVSILPIDFNELPAGAELQIVGWGTERSRGKKKKKKKKEKQCLQAANVTLSDCLDNQAPNPNNVFCATSKASNQSNACADIAGGGPVLYGARVVGIAAGRQGCSFGQPSIYARFSSFRIMSFLKGFLESYCAS